MVKLIKTLDVQNACDHSWQTISACTICWENRDHRAPEYDTCPWEKMQR